jgi:hypothetical protein
MKQKRKNAIFFHPPGTMRYNLPANFIDVRHTQLAKKFAVKQNLPVPNTEEIGMVM